MSGGLWDHLLVCVSLPNVARQWLGKHSHGNEYTCSNRRTVGHGVFYVVRIVSDTRYVVKRKWASSSSQNFLFDWCDHHYCYYYFVVIITAIVSILAAARVIILIYCSPLNGSWWSVWYHYLIFKRRQWDWKMPYLQVSLLGYSINLSCASVFQF